MFKGVDIFSEMIVSMQENCFSFLRNSSPGLLAKSLGKSTRIIAFLNDRSNPRGKEVIGFLKFSLI